MCHGGRQHKDQTPGGAFTKRHFEGRTAVTPATTPTSPRVRVLGGVTVDSALLTTSNRQLLALLVAAGPQGATTSQLVDELFGGRATTGSEGKVRVDISRLRQRLDDEMIPLGSHPYRINLGETEVDLWGLRNHYVSRTLPTDPKVLTTLLSGQPFPELEITPLIGAAIDEVIQARMWLLVSAASDAPDLIDGHVLAAATDFARRNIFDRQLVLAVVQAHLTAPVYADASRLIAFAEESWSDNGEGHDAEVLSALHEAARSSASGSTQPIKLSVADELMKLAELLEAGVLTDEEFAAQKKRLLEASGGSTQT